LRTVIKIEIQVKLFEELTLKVEKPDWSLNPEFGLVDTILEKNPDIYIWVKDDLQSKSSNNQFGRGDVPSVEQIVRAAIYKEIKGLTYRELEYAQSDSRICETFIKLDLRKPYSFQMFQKHISRIKPQTLQKILHHINQLAIHEGYEDIERICQDTTVVECNIKYPTNNGLVWDCIHESHRLLTHLKEEVDGFSFIDYTRQAKKNYFKINVTKGADKRYALFCKQLIHFTKVINQTSNVVKKNFESLKAGLIQIQMTSLIELMNQVYHMAYEREIEGNSVPNDKKLFSIYELHTDIIVKGQREVQFGHKISIANGTSNLILDCDILKGNPADKTIYTDVIKRIVGNYGIIPKDSAADGGYACKDNMNFAKEMQIKNIVFNKVVGSLKNQVSSKNIETRLKKWRSSGEAIISNLKRGFDLRRCTWKGWIHFQAKVLWGVIAYNIRVLTAHVISQIVAEQTPKVKLAA